MIANGFNRVIVKLSGEMLYDNMNNTVINFEYLKQVADELQLLMQNGRQVALVVGGGNIWRYRDHKMEGIKRVTSDYMGMFGTMINGLALKDFFENYGISTELFSALDVSGVLKYYNVYAATHALKKNQLVVLCGGTGSPFFTADTQTSLRACELACDVIIKVTKVDGVYDKDPEKNHDAVKYDAVTFDEVLQKHIEVMDSTAFSMCRDNSISIVVCKLEEHGDLLRAVAEGSIGTLIKP